MAYNQVNHEQRLKFNLSCNDYCVADTIQYLSFNKANQSGWCYASRAYLGKVLGLTKQAILNIIDKLVKSDLVEVHAETKNLRPTANWYKYFTDGKENIPESNDSKIDVSVNSLYRKGKKSLPVSGKDSLPYIDNLKLIEEINILKKEKEISENEISTLTSERDFFKSELEKLKSEQQPKKEKKEKAPQTGGTGEKKVWGEWKDGQGDGELHELLKEYFLNPNSPRYEAVEYQKFKAYWTAKVLSGRQKGKELWRTKETFSISGRLSTWNQNKQNGSNSTKYQKIVPLAPTGIEPQNGRRFGKL